MAKNRLLMLLALAGFGSDAWGETLVSPPLPVIKNQQLVIQIPSGWKIVEKAELRDWHTSSYDFQVQSNHPGLPHEIVIEVLIHALGRAQRHGDLSGQEFVTASGLRGILHKRRYGHRPCDWYLAFPMRATDGALIVRVAGVAGNQQAQRRFVSSLYTRIRFQRSKAK